jgi:hypothetical protein
MGFWDSLDKASSSFKTQYNHYVDQVEGKLKETNREYEQKARETGRRNFEYEVAYEKRMDSLENSRFKK